jgi:hypothetical protein
MAVFFQTAIADIVEVDATSGVSGDPGQGGYSPTPGGNGGVGENVTADASGNSDASNTESGRFRGVWRLQLMRAVTVRLPGLSCEPGVSNPAGPVTAASSGRIFRWWRLCWISASNKSAVRAAARRGKASVPLTPANRLNGKCAYSDAGPFGRSIVVPPAAIARRSVRTSSRRLLRRL